MMNLNFKNISKYHIKVITYIGLVLLALVILMFVVIMIRRDHFLHSTITKLQNKIEQSYNVKLDVSDYGFDGFTSVYLRQVHLIPVQRDTLFIMDQAKLSVDFLSILFGKVKIGSLSVDRPQLRLIERDSSDNYSFFLRDDAVTSSIRKTTTDRDFGEGVGDLVRKVFRWIPEDIKISEFSISYNTDSLSQLVIMPYSIMHNHRFESKLFLQEDSSEWLLTGKVLPRKEELELNLRAGEEKSELPFLREKWGLGVSFDEVFVHLKEVNRSQGLLSLKGNWSLTNLLLDHWRLSDRTITLPNATGYGGILLGKDYMKIAEGTKIKIEEFEVSPFLKLDFSPIRHIELALHTGVFQAQKFFDALPAGLFPTLEGLQTSGDIAYDMEFKIDLEKPDSLYFISQIDDADLKIIKWGNADIASLNQPFMYHAYEDTVLAREIWVGDKNPNFVSIGEISSFLKQSVLTTEDPSFYSHKGFEIEAFRMSIATNVKEKRFKRGASTLSMQLMKNLYLGRDKTMFRKFEEIILVWLAEHSQQVPKSRLLEIYLNIIEWGRDVYGITEASRYYFSKRPSQLELGESLYLASIIPRPKTGLSSFDYTGHLRPWLGRYFQTYGSIMERRGLLDSLSVDDDYGFNAVVLRESLRPSRPIETLDSLGRTQAEQDSIKKQVQTLLDGLKF